MQIILSSTSPARKELLARLGLPFEIIAPEVDESPLPHETPTQMVKRLAVEKAKIHSQRFPNALIIGCDQVIVLDDEVMGKPGDHANAVKQLTQSSGHRLTSLTGICLLNTATQKIQTEVENFYVSMRQLTPAMIESYLQRDKPYQCAGSIRAEGLGVCLFDALEGRDPAALTGLPLIVLVRMLENEGIKII